MGCRDAVALRARLARTEEAHLPTLDGVAIVVLEAVF